MLPTTWNLIISYGARVSGALLLIVVAMIAARLASRAVLAATGKAGLEETLRGFLATLVRWLINVVAVVMSLGIFGVQTTSVAALLGAAGLAVALAFQGTLSNFAAGVMLLIFRPFKVGDFVELGGRKGTVQGIDMFFTALDTVDNRRLILPNSRVFGAEIDNYSFHDIRRADIKVGTDYGADIDETRVVLEQVADAIEGRLADRPAQVVLLDLGASSIDWEIRIWCLRSDLLVVSQQIRRDVKVALDAAGIGIPFPQMDVHVDGALG